MKILQEDLQGKHFNDFSGDSGGFKIRTEKYVDDFFGRQRTPILPEIVLRTCQEGSSPRFLMDQGTTDHETVEKKYRGLA